MRNFGYITFVLLLAKAKRNRINLCRLTILNACRLMVVTGQQTQGEVMSSLYTKIDSLMDAKYNRYLDSGVLRMSLVAVGFTAWLIGGIALLKFV